MAQTSSQATAEPTPYPSATGYTFVDEMWRTQTACPIRFVVKDPDGGLQPVRPPGYSYHDFPHTAAQRAAAEDLDLWVASSSPDDYEERKHKKRVELEAAAKIQPTFPKFQLFPSELQVEVWKLALALAEPTVVTIATPTPWRLPLEEAAYEARRRSYDGDPAHRDHDGRVGDDLYSCARDYVATAFLPPLLLASGESHQLAVEHYKRVFKNLAGRGGVLAAYPTELHVEDRAFWILIKQTSKTKRTPKTKRTSKTKQTSDIDLVHSLVLEDRGVYGKDDAGHLAKVGSDIHRWPNLSRFMARSTVSENPETEFYRQLRKLIEEAWDQRHIATILPLSRRDRRAIDRDQGLL
ncbi:hypothetical protein F5X97DRAFT_342940 [Nemania serpens]|nr:hypothetical protein F5X97DRAFT_342940 [Nemania serpens]